MEIWTVALLRQISEGAQTCPVKVQFFTLEAEEHGRRYEERLLQ